MQRHLGNYCSCTRIQSVHILMAINQCHLNHFSLCHCVSHKGSVFLWGYKFSYLLLMLSMRIQYFFWSRHPVFFFYGSGGVRRRFPTHILFLLHMPLFSLYIFWTLKYISITIVTSIHICMHIFFSTKRNNVVQIALLKYI